MSEYRDEKRDQSAPKQGIQNVTDAVIADLKERTEFGTKKYGRPLETHNGRNALLDAYQEAVDLALYLKQAVLEGKPSNCKLVLDYSCLDGLCGMRDATKAQADYVGARGGGKSPNWPNWHDSWLTDPERRISQLTEALAESRKETYEMTESRDSYLASFRNGQEKVAALNKLLKEMTHHRDFLSTSLRVDRENASERIGGLGRQVDGLRNAITERDATITKLTKELNDPHRIGDISQHWKEASSRAVNALSISESLRLGLEGELNAAQDSIRSLRETLKETEDRRMVLVGKLTEEQNLVRGFQLKLEDSEKSRMRVAGELAKTEAQVTSLALLLGNCKVEAASLMATYERTINERDKARKDVDILTVENSQIRGERNAANARVAWLVNQNEGLTKRIAELISTKRVVGSGGTTRSGNTEWTIKPSKPTFPDGHCISGGPCPCYPDAQS